MIKLLRKTAWISFLLAFLLAFMAGSKVHAQESSQSASSSADQAAQKYGIRFPVAELGNCSSLSECRSFCDDPLNHDACIAFSQKKGFYKQNNTTAFKNALLNAAKTELGCASEDACKTFCGQQENWQKCGDFAKKHNLGGGQVQDPSKQEILTKAKSFLGCDSVDSCKGFCTKEENRTKCDEFAKLVGLRGGVEKKGPGGCTSLETCKAYCLDTQHTEECSRMGVRVDQLRSPGMPAFMNADEKARFCREHPDVCKQATGSGNIHVTGPDAANKCVQYGCTWTGTGCSCPNGPKPPSSVPPQTHYCTKPVNGCGDNAAWDQLSCSCKSYEDYCKSRGGSWNGTNCIISTPPPPAVSSGPTGVQGVSAIRILIQDLLNSFK